MLMKARILNEIAKQTNCCTTEMMSEQYVAIRVCPTPLAFVGTHSTCTPRAHHKHANAQGLPVVQQLLCRV